LGVRLILNLLFIDIGSFAIKTLYFQGKYKKISLKEYLVYPTRKDSDLSKLEQITASLTDIKTKYSYTPDKVYVSFPSDKTVSKYIQVPFKDKKRINNSLPLELEDILPFDLEDLVYDWRLVERVGKISNIISYITSKTDLSMYIDALEIAGYDPDYIIPSTDAFINILERIYLSSKNTKVKKDLDLDSQEPCLIYIDFGFNKTNVFLCVAYKVKHIRTIAYGGDYITKSIQEELGKDYIEAENIKISEGFIDLNEDENILKDNKLSNIISNAYDLIIRDLNQTISYFKASEKITINNGFLLGNGWKVKNFDKYLQKELKINFEEFNYFNLLNLNYKFNENLNTNIMHNVIGLSLLQQDKDIKGINFRKGSFSKSKTTENVNQTLKLLKPSFYVLGFILIGFFFYSFINSFLLSSAIKDYRDQIDAKIKTAFSDLRPRQIEILFEDLDKLNKDIIERLETQKNLIESGDEDDGEPSSLKILTDLSSVFPKNKTVDILELQINKNTIKIVKGLVPNAATVKDITDAMERNNNFSDIKQGNIRIAVDGVNREFDLTAIYKGK